MSTFTLDSFIKVTNELERVMVEISLCGCANLVNNWFVPVFLKGFVILIYSLR